MSALLSPPRRRFVGHAQPVPPTVRARMEGCSWKDEPACPRFDELRYLEVDHLGFDGAVRRGELVVAAVVAPAALALMRRLFELGFPIRSLRLVDDFGADDDASMAADNGSAFNYRLVAGTQVLSMHGRGLAIDLNPVENPWVVGERVVPAAGTAYLDRTDVRPGMIVRPGPVVAALRELDWEWGGDWRHARDYHHVVWARR
ncbi:MAG: M15 family metallopeptidase [Kofleriaceae bacterium]